MTDSSPQYEPLVEHAPVGVFQMTVESMEEDKLSESSGEIYANKTLVDLLGFDSKEHLQSERDAIAYADPADEIQFQERLQQDGHVEAFETTLITNDGEHVDVLLSGTFEDDELRGYVTDITDKKRLEQKAQKQAEAILEQSIPIVQIWDGITLATVVGTLDTGRAQRLTEQLLTELTDNQSGVALVDITGVPNIDTATAQHLIDTVKAVTLLGSEVIITGINPDIAQTLVQLGITMDEIRTKSSLSEGLELGLRLIEEEPSLSTLTESG